MGRAKISRGRGKPRRSKQISEIYSVRVPPLVKAKINAYFGSMGNALVYLYRGIEELKRDNGLPSETDEEEAATLAQHELEDIFFALLHYAKDERHHHNYKKRLERIARKILDISSRGEEIPDPETMD